jgi:chorismate-pyruvate lyase
VRNYVTRSVRSTLPRYSRQVIATVSPHPRVVPELDSLVALFYDAPDWLGNFAEVQAADMPPVYQGLLAHNHHMTVTVEQRHGSLVDVHVLAAMQQGHHYARKILLTRRLDGRVVQFGIVRIDLSFLGNEVRREIESQSTPLGRILIEHNVLREVELFKLWRVAPGEDLCRLFNVAVTDFTYGRTALIHCNGQPAIELLEIVTPE